VLKTLAIGILATFAVLVVLMLGYLAFLGAQSRNMSVSLGVVDDRLRECPPTPNCVSSDADSRDSHFIAPLADPSGAKWARLQELVAALPGARLVAASDGYAHITFTSRLFGFVDDVEFHFRPAAGVIAVRSASRVGRGDLDANRKRIEAIRTALG